MDYECGSAEQQAEMVFDGCKSGADVNTAEAMHFAMCAGNLARTECAELDNYDYYRCNEAGVKIRESLLDYINNYISGEMSAEVRAAAADIYENDCEQQILPIAGSDASAKKFCGIISEKIGLIESEVEQCAKNETAQKKIWYIVIGGTVALGALMTGAAMAIFKCCDWCRKKRAEKKQTQPKKSYISHRSTDTYIDREIPGMYSSQKHGSRMVVDIQPKRERTDVGHIFEEQKIGSGRAHTPTSKRKSENQSAQSGTLKIAAEI